MACHVCEGRETIDSEVRLQLIAEAAPDRPPPFVALCREHGAIAEGAYSEIKRIQSRPVTINLPGLRIGGATGRM